MLCGDLTLVDPFDDEVGESMPIPTDPRLLDIACDVTIRLHGHSSYGGEEGALKALHRRVPGYSPGEYRAVLDLLSRAYERAVAAIPRHSTPRPDKATNFAELEDVDYAACMVELDEIEPGVATREKGLILNWCIFWHYLK